MSISRREVMMAGLAGASGGLLGRCVNFRCPGCEFSNRIIADDYTITPGHPRLYVRPSELADLRLRAQTTNITELESLLAFHERVKSAPPPPTRPASQPATATSTPPTTGPGRRRGGGGGFDNSEAIVRLSLLYLLAAEAAHAQVAVSQVERLLQIPVNGSYFGAQRRVRALGIAYDYLHDYLDEPYTKRIITNI